jgi:hypothetical protein
MQSARPSPCPGARFRRCRDPRDNRSTNPATRALLGRTPGDLAEVPGVGTAAIQRMEKSEQMMTGYVFTLIRLQGAFEKAGIQFDQHIPYDDSEEDLEEPIPPLSGFFRVMTFCLLMASIGSGAGTICHFYAPDLTALAGASDIRKLTKAVDTQTEQQRKLAETIGAVQLGQDALQKALAAREQDIPRLSAEVLRALNCDVETLRTAAAAAVAPHPTIAQAPKRSASPPPGQEEGRTYFRQTRRRRSYGAFVAALNCLGPRYQ